MIKIDMWYDESFSNATKFDCFWSDIDCVYRGNIYQGNRMIGDYTASTLQEFEDKWKATHTQLDLRITYSGYYHNGSDLVFRMAQLNYDLIQRGYDEEHRKYVINAVLEKAIRENADISKDEYAKVFDCNKD